MSTSLKRKVAIWFWNLIRAGWAGGLNSVGMALGIESVNVISPGRIQSMTPNQFWMAVVSGGVIGIYMYLKTPAGSLPEISPEDTDTFPGGTKVPKVPKVP